MVPLSARIDDDRLEFPALRHLSLRGQRLGGQGVAAVSNLALPALESLDLGGTIRGRECSSGALNWLAYRRRPGLRRLNLDGWRLLRAYARAEAAKLALAFPDLDALSLSVYADARCSLLNDDGLRAAAAELPALRELAVSGLEREGLTREGVRAVLAGMPRLHTLRLTVGVGDRHEVGKPVWPDLFEETARLRCYAPHSRSSAVCMELRACDGPGPHRAFSHVFYEPPRALHDFESDPVGDV